MSLYGRVLKQVQRNQMERWLERVGKLRMAKLEVRMGVLEELVPGHVGEDGQNLSATLTDFFEGNAY